jgi:glycosyltransferase involved in cell wall biosynthesis
MGTHQLRQISRRAAAVLYVTQETLQLRYPAGPESYVASVSDALTDNVFASAETLSKRASRIESLGKYGEQSIGPFRTGFVGTLERLYKGPDILLRAAALCRERGLKSEYFIVGSGRHTHEMKRLAKRLGMEDQVHFMGQLAFGQAVLDFLDGIDLFVLPSRAEGLPRALLEAMARGCPCIASDVGGVRELLTPDEIVPSGRPELLADAILKLLADPQRMQRLSTENFKKANEYSPERLRRIRRGFLEALRLRSQEDQLARAARQKLAPLR